MSLSYGRSVWYTSRIWEMTVRVWTENLKKKENTWQDIIKTDLKNRAWPYQIHLAPGRIQWPELMYNATNLHVLNVCFRCYIHENKIYGTFERHVASRRNS